MQTVYYTRRARRAQEQAATQTPAQAVSQTPAQAATQTSAQAEMPEADQQLSLQQRRDFVLQQLQIGSDTNAQTSLNCPRVSSCGLFLLRARRGPFAERQEEVTDLLKGLHSLGSALNPNATECLVAHRTLATIWCAHDKTMFSKHYEAWLNLLPPVIALAESTVNESFIRELNDMVQSMSRVQTLCADISRQRTEAELVGGEGAYEAVQGLLALQHQGTPTSGQGVQSAKQVLDGLDLVALRKDLDDHQAVLDA